MKTKSQLREERGILGHQMDELIKRPGDMTAEDSATFDKIELDLRSIDKQIDILDRASEIRSIKSDGKDAIVEHVAQTADKSEKEARAAWEDYIMLGERLSEEKRGILKRATDTQSIGTGQTDQLGGITVPTIFSDMLIKVMLAFGGVLNEVNIRQTANGDPETWPKRDTTARKGRRIGELVTETVNSFLYSNVVLNMYKYSSDILLLSWDLAKDSILNMENEVLEVNGESLARIVEEELTLADGSSKPLGFVPGGTLSATIAGTNTLTIDELITFTHSLNTAYRGTDDKLYFNDNTLQYLRKFKDTTGQPIWQRDYRGGAPDTLLGLPYRIIHDMADLAAGNKFMVYGNLKKAFAVRKVKGDTLVVLREKYALEHSNGYFINSRWGSTVKDANAIQVLKAHA